ncbi:conserved exported hypothetical protein [Bosea sp. 62]|nr:conserved exported hypothetical protein [Bosea sp. 46]CAD5262197.1 conserved exported hypothetical protein [Bosea sp. 21B]CAD5278302.1 conserved exported hypothetical protein [Bosea sp. 7B]VVT58667.1 conserved exported hypothetical protein [Bosea sp. EC-HK365B]VXB58479.1 conserved exported hypothetical protein [Bosea sp. 29B]VXB99440.1 conserved exported hypothetical protein [Bosea sp. 125]VXC41366.1 conserved exported hypothetical protein [Bosea sp. 62]VXC80807.1 conserved exported hypot
MQLQRQRRVVFGGLGLLGAALMALPATAQVVDFRSSDREMNRAIEQARKTLPDFVALYRSGKGERHAVKVAIPYDRGREHIWMNLTAVEGDVFVGKIANDPVHLDKLNRGDSYRVGSAMVSDWNYMSGGQMYGSYTTRVAIKKLTPTQVRELGLKLAPLP